MVIQRGNVVAGRGRQAVAAAVAAEASPA
jgi:hypothetical protein